MIVGPQGLHIHICMRSAAYVHFCTVLKSVYANDEWRHDTLCPTSSDARRRIVRLATRSRPKSPWGGLHGRRVIAGWNSVANEYCKSHVVFGIMCNWKRKWFLRNNLFMDRRVSIFNTAQFCACRTSLRDTFQCEHFVFPYALSTRLLSWDVIYDFVLCVRILILEILRLIL